MEREIIPIVGDGNCLFRSISFNLYGHQNNHREIRLHVVQKIANEWETYKYFIVGDESYLRSLFDVQQCQTLLSRDGEYAGYVELQCISELYSNYLFRVHREVAGETVTYDCGSGEDVCDLIFSGNVDSGHYSVIKLSHNPQGVKRTKRKRKGKKSLTGCKETTRTAKQVKKHRTNKVKNSDGVKCALEVPTKNTDSFELGSLNWICHYCESMNFEAEQTNRDKNKCSLCCQKEKVKLASYQHSEFMENFINGATSTIKESIC